MIGRPVVRYRNLAVGILILDGHHGLPPAIGVAREVRKDLLESHPISIARTATGELVMANPAVPRLTRQGLDRRAYRIRIDCKKRIPYVRPARTLLVPANPAR